ncbi:hypothetical protein [Mycobacterium marinum]|uniref:hypothetical protein n=1 Tax=Mycobacterium marinum TaxID=1781 RepID=UPI0021C4A801|nr:hypothetical protein [Mycobacterium marinum]
MKLFRSCPMELRDLPRRSNEFQHLVAMLTALLPTGAVIDESVELMECCGGCTGGEGGQEGVDEVWAGDGGAGDGSDR